ncbi:MAG TPA: LysR substrate-binding domain-containing protein [Rhodospirillales bacterium]|nr:LysR substrate-binding domain-containing protein [Rhodospirillales bacterium]
MSNHGNRLELIASFVQVVASGGFTAAAARLGSSRAVVSKHVIALERRLGVQLLNRTTRRVVATEAGLAYYERCSRILADLEEADVAVSRLQAQPRGTLKVNAPMSFGTLHLTPALIAFAELYPELRVNLVLNDRFVDMLDEGFDVGIRIGKLEDSTLIVRRIAPAKRVVCAAPGYLARHGTPAHPGELAGHACLHYGYLASGTTWKLSGADGEHSVAVEAGICVNNGEMLRDLAVAGLGIALLPTFIVGPALADGTLRSLLDDYRAPETAINVIYPPSRHLSAKVRVFTDFLVERIGTTPYWDQPGRG